MRLFWYSLRLNDGFALDSPPQILHGAVEASIKSSGEYMLEHNVCGISSLNKDDFGVPIQLDGFIVFFSDINKGSAYRALLDYIYASIAKWNHALVALENSLTFSRVLRCPMDEKL